MTPTITLVRLTGAADRAERPLLVLGPSLGTSATTLWTACAAAGLTDRFDVVAWDLPGHGHNHAVPDEPVSMADLAAGVLRVLDDVQEQRGDHGGPFFYAGDSVGGAVGLQLLLDHPDRVTSAAVVCSGARFGDPQRWGERIAAVRTPGLVPGSSAERWFAPGFLERSPEIGSTMLHALSDAADEGYVRVCEALADHDVRARLGEITAPVLAIAGAQDVAATVEEMREVADGVKDGRLVVLDDVAHMAPAEAPERVARLLLEHFLGEAGSLVSRSEVRDSRRASTTGTTPAWPCAGRCSATHTSTAPWQPRRLTEDFQRFITEYAWGGVWTRPGLDRRSRSMITLTALIARGHDEELALHVRAARTNGLSDDEIKEVILHSAIYCGVPAANTAFRIAQEVLGA